jgi:predicted PurR-regulated permease PerM
MRRERLDLVPVGDDPMYDEQEHDDGKRDGGTDGTSSSTEGVKSAVPNIGETLLKGVANGITGLTSLAFFLSFTLFSTFFLLKDGPTIRRFVDRHLGVPVSVASVVTGDMLNSLRRTS